MKKVVTEIIVYKQDREYITYYKYELGDKCYQAHYYGEETPIGTVSSSNMKQFIRDNFSDTKEYKVEILCAS